MTDTLNEALARAASTWPDKPFMRIDGAVVTFAQFETQVASLAAGFKSAGVEPGDRIAVLMRNSLACLHSWFAAVRLGAVWAPINTEFRGLTLGHVCELAAPRLFITDADLLDGLSEALTDRSIAVPVYVHDENDGKLAQGLQSMRVLYSRGGSAPVHAAQFFDQAALLFTSGTTGRSKACVLSHRYFIEQATILCRDFELRHDDVLYCPFPLYHADATALTTVPALLLGATAALSKRFSASRFWDDVREHGATVFDFMGATLAILYKAEPRADDADNTARLAWGVPVPEWAEDFERRFGLRVVELYGSVEASIPVTQRLHEPRVAGSCGRATQGYEVAIHDDRGEAVAAGVTGELVVRPARPSTIFDGYLGMPEATVEVTRNLWFHSGDLARIDEAGNVFFVGRRKEAIRRRGENISAFEVEEGVALHEDVMEVAVVGVPSELTEEEVKVFVVRRPGAPLDAHELTAHCQRTLARFQVPRYVEFVESLPKTPTGKIAKHSLKGLAVGPDTWDRESAERAPGVEEAAR